MPSLAFVGYAFQLGLAHTPRQQRKKKTKHTLYRTEKDPTLESATILNVRTRKRHFRAVDGPLTCVGEAPGTEVPGTPIFKATTEGRERQKKNLRDSGVHVKHTYVPRR